MDNIVEKVKPYFDGDQKGSHGYDHAVRVYNLGNYIAIEEDADVEIVQAACLLHDIGRGRKKGICHAKLGAEMSQNILKSIGFPENKIKSVAYCVRVHRYSEGIEPITLEAKIVQDADRLEEIGAIAIARGLAEDVLKGKPLYDPSIQPNTEYKSGGNKTSINFLIEKSLKLKPETFHTETARELAKDRYRFTEYFVESFIKEWNFSTHGKTSQIC